MAKPQIFNDVLQLFRFQVFIGSFGGFLANAKSRCAR